VTTPLHRVLAFRYRFRPSIRSVTTQPALLFATWAYRSLSLPPELSIDVATETLDGEPMLFLIPLGGRPDTVPIERCQPLVHPAGFGGITALHITLTRRQPMSPAVCALREAGLVSFNTDSEHLAEIEFDDGSQGQSIDFRPALKLRFHW
jgi:hypothetical protein